MLSNFISLYDQSNANLQAYIMFGVFAILIIVLVLFMTGGKKKSE